MSELDDLEADVRSAVEGTPAPEPVAAPEPIVEAPAPEPKVDGTGRVHAADGKFAPKTVDAKPETVQPIVAQAEEPETAILPPHSLKAAVKAQFAALPKDVQDEFLRIEGEAQKAKTEWQTKGEQYNRFEKLFEPINDRLTLSGLAKDQYVAALIHADELLRTNPGENLPKIAAMYGFQIPGMQAPQQQQIDPVLHGLQQQVETLTRTLQSQAEQGEQAKVAQAQAELDSFRNDPKHLYVDNVGPIMATFLRDGRAGTLDEAYDMACHADPTIRALVAAGSQPKAQPATPKDISVTGAPGQTRATPRTGASAEDDVRAAIEELTGRI